MPDIVVLYSGLKLVEVSWSKKHTLQRNNVLSIAVINKDVRNKRKRRQAVCEYDNYVLAWTDGYSYLGGFNDDFCWMSLTEPWEPQGKGYIFKFPYDQAWDSILFEGVQVSAEEYAKARVIFSDLKGRMY